MQVENKNMPISNLTAAIIAARDDIVVNAGGPSQNGKYTGWITLGPEDRYRPLLNSEAIYNGLEEAKQAMQKLVDDIRAASENRRKTIMSDVQYGDKLDDDYMNVECSKCGRIYCDCDNKY